MKLCKFCGIDISHLHHNSTHCKSPSCLRSYAEDRQNRVRETSKKYNKIYKEKNGKPTGRKCRYCGKILPGGRWFFCNEYCQNHFVGVGRYDGDFLYG